MKDRTLLAVVVFAACRPTSSLDYLSPPTASDSRTGLGMINARLSAAMRNEYAMQVEKTPAPMELVPTDGSELGLEALVADVRIDGPLAHTELHFTFHNTENRQREGRFKIELPTGAAVGRFAMLVNGDWREARVVSRAQGRQVYEGFLHQKVDPALLEQDVGNSFSARVFPIPANANKEIVIGYDHMVSATQPYTLGLRGLRAIPKLSVVITHDGAVSSVNHDRAVPDDLSIAIPKGDTALAAGVSFVARIEPLAETAGTVSLDHSLILVDTSASRSTVMGKQVELVRQLVTSMPADATVVIAAFDHEVSELYRGAAGSAASAVVRLYDHGALGASDLGGALVRAAVSGMTRVILIGDGVPTLGETVAGKLASRVTGTSIQRIDAVQVGATVDRDVLGVLVRAGTRPGAILDGRDPRRVVHQLSSALPAELPIQVEGGTEVWPKTTRGVAPGESIWVTGRRKAGSDVAIRIGDRWFKLDPKVGDATRVDRAVARAELAELSELAAATTDETKRTLLSATIQRIALANNLMSGETSFLVLESDADEARTLGARTTTNRTAERQVPVPLASRQDPVTGTVGGEEIRVVGRAPTVDPSSTSQGITITRDYVRNIPVPGRTFEAVLGRAAGSQGDNKGISFSGSTSIENHYYVDGVNTTGLTVRGDDLSVLAQDHIARQMRGTAFAFGLPPVAHHTEVELKVESPYTGVLHDIMLSLARNEREHALEMASRWRLDNPGDIAAIVGLGEALEARGAGALAARAYGSLIDLYPNRADLVRAAGERLDRIHGASELAIDAYRRSLKDRPDQLSTYRLLAFALFRAGRPDEAFDLVIAGRARASNSIRDVLLQDARVLGAYLVAHDKSKAAAVRSKLGTSVATEPSLHAVLSWETDANDVDLHVIDAAGDHAFYANRNLRSGGHLLDDLIDGFGPEMFVVDRPAAFPYTIAVHYFNRGPEGIGIGTVQLIHHDGNGNIRIEDRPFVLQKDQATVGLGIVDR